MLKSKMSLWTGYRNLEFMCVNNEERDVQEPQKVIQHV